MHEAQGGKKFHPQAAHPQHRLEPATKTVGTQSVYRESEAQTDPYSPEYVATDTPEAAKAARMIRAGL